VHRSRLRLDWRGFLEFNEENQKEEKVNYENFICKSHQQAKATTSVFNIFFIKIMSFPSASLVKAFRVLPVMAMLLLGIYPPIFATDGPKLLLIHLDAVSYHVLQEEMEAGNLPQIEYYFSRPGNLKKALTYYPSKTPFVISNVREGIPSSEGELVGWEIPVFEGDQSLSLVDSFLLMAFSKHRPARGNLFYGLPIFNRLNQVALMNTLDLFDEYPVIEFYWYAVDSYGHFYGEEAYREKIREFDSAIGRYISKLNDDISVIIYADHGMVFGEGIEIDKIAMEKFGDKISAFSYPSVYLYDETDKDEIARQLVHQTELDFAFYMVNDTTAKGYSNVGNHYFINEGDAVRYTYEGEDPFKYYQNGYSGEYLDADEWLKFSSDLPFPATPVKVFNYLSNPHSGDIVISFDDNKYAKTFYSSAGNHGGFSAADVVIPILLYGPNIDQIGNAGPIWLQELFNEVEDFEFNQNPARDRHYITSRYDFRKEATHVTAAISPVYRLNFGTDLLLNDDFTSPTLETIWGRYDLYRSYITRIWFGAGVDFRKEDTVGMMFLKHEMRYRNLTARTLVNTSGIHQFTLGYRVFPHVSVELTNFTGVGLRISL